MTIPAVSEYKIPGLRVNRISCGTSQEKRSSFLATKMIQHGREQLLGADSYKIRMADNTEFLRLAGSLSQKVTKLRSSTETIKSLTRQIGTPRDSDELRTKIRSRLTEAQQVLSDSASTLSRLESISKTSDSGLRYQVDRLKDDVIRVTNEFQEAQRELMSREKESLARARSATASSDVALVDIGQSDNLGLGPGSPSGGFGGGDPIGVRTSQVELDVDAAAIEQREREMEQLENDIAQVNNIYRDLGRLVHEQGEMVDSIAFNVESAHVAVESGAQNLEKAVKSKRAVRKKKIICFVIIFVALGVIIGIIVGATRNWK